MQISIQSLEVTHNKIPYRFIVKKVFNTSRNEVTFHCWAPDDNIQAKELIQSKVLMFEWDEQKEELRPTAENPLCEKLTEAIKESFSMERA